MAEKKAYEVDAWLARPDPKIAIVLIYGPDRGLVAERAKLFAAKSGVPADDAFSLVKLDAAEVERDPGRLIDEALQKAGVTMGLEARQALKRNLGGDRLASRSEIEKLMLFAHGQQTIELDDVLAATGDASSTSA